MNSHIRVASVRGPRATGDDTKLREFEAELAERQRQELEMWVVANRERLEQEAIDFQREQQRRRELHQTREP